MHRHSPFAIRHHPPCKHRLPIATTVAIRSCCSSLLFFYSCLRNPPPAADSKTDCLSDHDDRCGILGAESNSFTVLRIGEMVDPALAADQIYHPELDARGGHNELGVWQSTVTL
ncbi:hypothetical protein OIU74_013374 [Salix koriyanagi]|uniref:Uncharacterized protein n=1 Tax=Salix koriyanagi TaxID=2511006 RepID=A0A9Q0T6D8_9ROSI|nr:hypothetical protein OIU74_013374 [Salix koriyanagi]